MTIDEIIHDIDVKSSGRTRYEDQKHEYADEILVAEIRRLRGIIREFACRIGSLEEQIHNFQDPWEEE